MKRKLSMGSLLIAGALTGFTGQTGASMQSNPDGGTGEISQQKSQQGVGLEGASSSKKSSPMAFWSAAIVGNPLNSS